MKNFFKKTQSTYKLLMLCLIVCVSISTSANILIGDGKTCKFIEDGKYLPFSDVDGTFPIFGRLMTGGCVDVTNSVDNMVAYGFQVFLGIVTLIAVVQVSISGIQWMMKDTAASKSDAKKKLTNSLIGLILAMSSWLILNTVNPRVLNLRFNIITSPLQSYINMGAQQAAIATANGSGTSVGTDTVGGGTGNGDSGSGSFSGGDNPSNGPAVGTGDSTGAIRPNAAPTVFGFRDGDGSVGDNGDNGLGNGAWSPIPGWTYYNGGAHNPDGTPGNYSQGVALPRSTLIQDFGSVAEVKYGAYELFKNGVSVGVFPVVDDSASKLDLSYGLVKNHFDPNITSSTSWNSSSANITYKPLPGHWRNNPRPAQPMVRDDFTVASPNASVVDAQVQTPGNFGFK